MVIYSYMDDHGRAATFYHTPVGLRVLTNTAGAIVPDDEIPVMISALQNYMSKRAKAITKAAANAR